MIPYFGDFPEDATVYIPINTFDSNDPAASVTATNLLNTDVHIHKDGGTTQRNNAAGITMTIDYDSIVGNHLLIIDTSDDTVVSFWQAGHEYQVRIEGITVDGGTLNAWVGAFSIERAGGALALIKNATYGLSALNALLAHADYGLAKLVRSTTPANTLTVDANHLVAVPSTQKVDLETIKTQALTCGAGVTFGVYVGGTGAAALASEVTAARMGALTDLIDGGRLDLILDAILTDTGTTLQGELDAIEAAVITNAAGTDIAADIIALKAVADTIQADTDLLDDVSGGLADIHTDVAAVKADTAAILIDTGTTLQGELDAIEAAVITNAAGVDIAADIIALKAVADAVLEDTGTTLDTLIKDIPTVAEFEARTLVAADYTVVGDLGVVQTADHTAAIADIPTVAEFNARSLPSADYTVVGDLGVVQTGDSFAIVNGDHGLVSIQDDIDAILLDTGTTLDGKLDTIQVVTDKLDTAMELDVAVYRFTENALEQAPTGGSAPTVTQIRQEMDANSTKLAAIVADTNELQADLHDGGRLDLLVDAVKGKTDGLNFTGTYVDAQVKAQDNIDFGALQKASITVAAPTTAAIADKVLGRSIAGGADGGRMVKDALKVLRNKRGIAEGVLTVYEADDVTPAWTATVATAEGNPVSEVDPA